MINRNNSNRISIPMDRLLFRRQFLLTYDSIPELENWNLFRIDSYFLHVHPDLIFNEATIQARRIILLGSIFDPDNPEKTNATIVNDILLGTSSIAQLFLNIKKYSGSYIFLYWDQEKFIIWSDARAVQEIYYCTTENRVICGSQPNLLVKFSDPTIKPQNDPNLLDFYNHHLWDSRWVGDETYFSGVKHLLPNRYLDILSKVVCRYWPNTSIASLTLEEAVYKSSAILRGSLKAILYRHKVMMALTGGSDSRTLLAASRDIKNQIYFFINDNGLGREHPDITIPKRIMRDIGEELHIHDVPPTVDEGFRNIFINSTFLANDRLLPSIYNVFFKITDPKILVLGVGEIGRTFYGLEPKNLNSYRIAYKLGYTKSPYVISQCEKYMREMLPIARKYHINPMIILYWEQRLGNWAAVRNSESKIAIDKLDPYNSHLMNEIFIGVDEKYKNYQTSLCILFREMIRYMWPELLNYQVNPSVTIRDIIKSLMISSRTYEVLKEFKYQLSYMDYWFRHMVIRKRKIN